MSSIVEEAFHVAAEITFREWGEAEIVRVEAGTPTEVTAWLDLQALTKGFLALRFPEATARALSERILARASVELSDVWDADCLGETANVLAGQAKTCLFGTPFHFNIGTPKVTTGPGPSAEDCVWLHYQSDLGPFSIQVNSVKSE